MFTESQCLRVWQEPQRYLVDPDHEENLSPTRKASARPVTHAAPGGPVQHWPAWLSKRP